MKIKICGIKNLTNLMEITKLQPDYVGFIFYPKSKRYMADTLTSSNLQAVPKSIKKVGVFVSETINEIIAIAIAYKLNAIQLHGNESPEFVKKLVSKLSLLRLNESIEIIKAFGIEKEFDFNKLNDYKQWCNYFLFDTKTPIYGGSGSKFNWEILNQYDNEIPFFLSGGIGTENLSELIDLKKLNIYAVDMNSKLEIEPGLKDISKVSQSIDFVRFEC